MICFRKKSFSEHYTPSVLFTDFQCDAYIFIVADSGWNPTDLHKSKHKILIRHINTKGSVFRRL